MSTVLFNQTYISGAWHKVTEGSVELWKWEDRCYQFRVTVLLNSQDINAGTSNVTCNFYIKGLNGWYYSGHDNKTYIYLKTSENTTYTQVKYTNYRYMGGSGVEYLMLSYTGDVAHNNDGSLDIEFKCTYAGSSGTNYLPRPQNRETGWLTLPNLLPLIKIKDPTENTNNWYAGTGYIKISSTEWKKMKQIFVKYDGTWRPGLPKG